MVRRSLLLLFFVTAIAAGCTSLGGDSPFSDAVPVPDAAADAIPLGPTLSAIRANILEPRCTAPCHSGGVNAAGGMDMSGDTHAAIVGVTGMGSGCGTSGIARVEPGDATASLLYLKTKAKADGVAAPCGEPMPFGTSRAPLSAAELEFVRLWIEGGAEDD